MTAGLALTLASFMCASSLALLRALLVGGGESSIEARLNDLTDPGQVADSPEMLTRVTQSALPKLGKPLVPTDEVERTRLKASLVHAGLYRPHAMAYFLGAKML